MKYRVEHQDSDRTLLMKEMINFDGTTEQLLREQCEKQIARRQRCDRRLAEAIDGYTTEKKYRYEITGREAILYIGDDNSVGEITIATPIGSAIQKGIRGRVAGAEA